MPAISIRLPPTEALCDRSVDLVPKDGLKPIIRDHVISSLQVIYAT